MPPKITIISTVPDWCQAKNLRIDEAELAGGEITGETGEGAGEGECAELVREDRKSDGAHALLVDADTGERAAEGGVQNLIQNPIDGDQCDQRQIEKLRRTFEIEGLEAGNGQFWPDIDVDAIGAAAQFGVVKDRIEHLCEGEGDHDEIDARGAHDQEANDESGASGGGHGCGKSEPETGRFIFRCDQC